MAPKDLLSTPTRHFSIRVQDSDLHQGKLMIPEKIRRKYGSSLPTSVKLQVCSGAAWKVGLEERDGAVWLRSGLKEFMDYYSIVHGQFLVFKYKKQSNFKVTILDASGTEIEYKCGSIRKEATPEKNKDSENDDSQQSLSPELVEESLPSKKREDKLPTAASRPQKLRRTNSKPGQSSGQEKASSVASKKVRGGITPYHFTTEDHEPVQQQEAAVNGNAKWADHGESATGNSTQRPLCSRICKGLEAADEFTSSKPFFKIVVKASYLNQNNYMYLPLKFFRDLVELELKNQNVTLQCEGRSWPMRMTFRSDRSVLQGGWRGFAQENSLQVGDVCVFELLNKDDLLLKVSLFRHKS